MKTLYRIVLQHECGITVLHDNIRSEDAAYQKARKLAKKYGEGQCVFVEGYWV